MKQAQADRAHGVDRATDGAEEAVPVSDSPTAARGQRAVSLVDIHMAYGTNQVYRGLDLTVERGERTVLVGPNGAGKSTLLKFWRRGAISKGRTRPWPQREIGYFSQHRADTLDPSAPCLRSYRQRAAFARRRGAWCARSFMFRKDDISRRPPCSAVAKRAGSI